MLPVIGPNRFKIFIILLVLVKSGLLVLVRWPNSGLVQDFQIYFQFIWNFKWCLEAFEWRKMVLSLIVDHTKIPQVINFVIKRVLWLRTWIHTRMTFKVVLILEISKFLSPEWIIVPGELKITQVSFRSGI